MHIEGAIAICGIWIGVGLVGFGLKGDYAYIVGVAFFAMISTMAITL